MAKTRKYGPRTSATAPCHAPARVVERASGSRLVRVFWVDHSATPSHVGGVFEQTDGLHRCHAVALHRLRGTWERGNLSMDAGELLAWLEYRAAVVVRHPSRLK